MLKESEATFSERHAGFKGRLNKRGGLMPRFAKKVIVLCLCFFAQTGAFTAQAAKYYAEGNRKEQSISVYDSGTKKLVSKISLNDYKKTYEDDLYFDIYGETLAVKFTEFLSRSGIFYSTADWLVKIDIKSRKLLAQGKPGMSVDYLKFTPDGRFIVLSHYFEGVGLVDANNLQFLRNINVDDRIRQKSGIYVTMKNERIVPLYLPFTTPEYARDLNAAFDEMNKSKQAQDVYDFIQKYGASDNEFYADRWKMLGEARIRMAALTEAEFAALSRAADADRLLAFNAKVYVDDATRAKAFDELLRIYAKKPEISKYQKIIGAPKAPQRVREEAVGAIFKLVKAENNIAGYKWFMDAYPASTQAREALRAIHEMAFNQAKSVNSIAAYNDFIVAYPLAAQREQAEDRAYTLEEREYSSFFTSDEKLARGLAVKTMQIRRRADETGNKAYYLVAARMTRLLENKFPATEATEAHLAREEIRNLLKDIRGQLEDIKANTAAISSNTADLSNIIKEQSRLMDSHFTKAAEDRALSEKYTADHRMWERYLKDS
ncbi:MAG: hypothetical protein LBE89_00985 [Helicobacteraceae bacterium]|jgi:hypothetical protein|nr:hypothetical protein [Helicobacteraceae bacterium]